MVAAYNAAEDLYKELSAKNPKWATVFADWSKFREDSNLWFQVTEARFDGFMQTGRKAARAPAKAPAKAAAPAKK
jgi:TRAP-type mannitol/chloroaromatic compound transport system substrate-binding protein